MDDQEVIQCLKLQFSPGHPEMLWKSPLYSIYYNFTCPGANLTSPAHFFLVTRDNWVTISFKHWQLSFYICMYISHKSAGQLICPSSAQCCGHTLVTLFTTLTLQVDQVQSTRNTKTPQITNFMGPTWGPPGSCRPQMGPILAPSTLLSGAFMCSWVNMMFTD